MGQTKKACCPPTLRFLPRKHSKPELCANPEEGWVQNLMRRLDQPPAPGKQSPGCRKNREPLSLERKERAPRAARGEAAEGMEGEQRGASLHLPLTLLFCPARTEQTQPSRG